MWKRRRIWLMLVALSCVAIAGSFEPTRCVRGWLWGEAFFDGRPTSYWRGRIDHWLERYDQPEDAARGITLQGRADPLMDSRKVIMRPRVVTFWTRGADFFRSDRERVIEVYGFPPPVLRGTIDAEPVLLELAAEEKYKLFTDRALHNVAYYKNALAKEAQP